MRITDYQIISAASPTNLKTQVIKLLREGWQPLGGVAIEPASDLCWATLYQTMVQVRQ